MAAPPRRADAAGNRARILVAARAEIAANPDVRLNAIAQRAGVGQGTLYRHFPTRADLLAEVYRADVDELVAAVDMLLADHEPLVALRRWFDRVAEYAEVKRGVFAALEVGTWQELSARSHGPIGDAITRLLDAGRGAGRDHPHRLPVAPGPSRVRSTSPSPARRHRRRPPHAGPVASFERASSPRRPSRRSPSTRRST